MYNSSPPGTGVPNNMEYSAAPLYDPRLTYTSDRFNIEYSVNIYNNFSTLAESSLGPFIKFRGHSSPELHKDPRPIWADSTDVNFRHEFLTGLAYSTVKKTEDIFALRRGLFAEISLGYAIGSAPRLSLESRIHEELISTDILVLEFRGRLLGDYLFPGARYDDYSFLGGSSMKSGLGGAVRGFESRSYATPFKAVLNSELLLIFALFEDLAINPGIMIFADGGIYAGETNYSGGGLFFCRSGNNAGCPPFV